MPSPGVDSRYAAHFVDPLYESRVLDAAPFGSDQGADMLHDVEAAGGVLAVGATLGSLLPWGDVDGCFAAAIGGDVDGLQLIYAAGFLLLRYGGQIDESDHATLCRALEGIAEVMGLERLSETVLPDLESFLRPQS